MIRMDRGSALCTLSLVRNTENSVQSHVSKQKGVMLSLARCMRSGEVSEESGVLVGLDCDPMPVRWHAESFGACPAVGSAFDVSHVTMLRTTYQLVSLKTRY